MDKGVFEKYLKPLRPLATSLTNRGSLKAPKQCLLCDIYGTLLISGSGDINVFRGQPREKHQIEALLRRFDQPLSADELLARFCNEIEKQHAAAKSNGIQHPEVQIEHIWRSVLPLVDVGDLYRFALEFEMIVNPVWPMPHLSELLAFCRRTEVHLGIISNAQFYTPRLFEWLLRADLKTLGFDSRLTILSYQHGQAKPAAALFEMARERLRAMGITADAVVYIGNDVRNDIRPAAHAGFQTVLFAGDARSLRLRRDDPCCKEVKPDLIVTDLKQLVSYLQR